MCIRDRYLHGWNDYFFQTALADYWHAQGAAFYALDLRKYGRSLRPHQTPNYVDDLATYDEELDAAVAQIHTELGNHARVMVMGHSMGGLVAVLWAHRPHDARAHRLEHHAGDVHAVGAQPGPDPAQGAVDHRRPRLLRTHPARPARRRVGVRRGLAPDAVLPRPPRLAAGGAHGPRRRRAGPVPALPGADGGVHHEPDPSPLARGDAPGRHGARRRPARAAGGAAGTGRHRGADPGRHPRPDPVGTARARGLLRAGHPVDDRLRLGLSRLGLI